MATRWAVTAAARASDLPAPARLIIFVLADVADNDTAAVPEARTLSLAELAQQTGLSRRAVAQHLTLLEKSGWVKRDRPEAKAARAGAKTQYRLKIGGSASHALVHQMHHPPSAPDAPPSAGGALALVHQVHPPSAPGALKRKNPSTTPHKPSIASPSASLQAPAAAETEIIDEPKTALAVRSADIEPVNTQAILAAWIDYCGEHRVQLPGRLKGHYADGIKKALDEGFSPDIIKRALASMLTDGIASRPSLLPNRLVAAQTGPERWPRRLTPGEVTAARMTNNGQDAAVVSLIQGFFKDVS